MSFVNLLANDVWSEADIVRRTEAMIRSEFSADAETILNRKVSGMALGAYKPSAADQVEIARYNKTAHDAQVAGAKARADMALLQQVFAIEAAARRLSQHVVAPEFPEEGSALDPSLAEGLALNADAVAQDEAERANAQAVIDAASEEARALFQIRNPEPAPPEPDAGASIDLQDPAPQDPMEA